MKKIDQDSAALCEHIAELAVRRKLGIAVAESLTSGQIAAALGAAPNASDWFLGGVVAYTHQVKYDVLDVPEGPVVTAEAAAAMAAGVRRLTSAQVTVAVTGAGGPEGQDGQPPGTVFIGACTADRLHTEHHHFDGEPEVVLERTVEAALRLLLAMLQTPAATAE